MFPTSKEKQPVVSLAGKSTLGICEIYDVILSIYGLSDQSKCRCQNIVRGGCSDDLMIKYNMIQNYMQFSLVSIMVVFCSFKTLLHRVPSKLMVL